MVLTGTAVVKSRTLHAKAPYRETGIEVGLFGSRSKRRLKGHGMDREKARQHVAEEVRSMFKSIMPIGGPLRWCTKADAKKEYYR